MADRLAAAEDAMMRLTLVTGGARSGKSHYAERLALGEPATYIATAEPRDAEMEARIARHREQRPEGWITVERPLAVSQAILDATTAVVLLDCLTLLASNLVLDAEARAEDGEAALRNEVGRLLEVRTHRTGALIVVTNEVGLGVVPATRLGRIYRDALGQANRMVAAAADQVILMVSGIPMVVKGTANSPVPAGEVAPAPLDLA